MASLAVFVAVIWPYLRSPLTNHAAKASAVGCDTATLSFLNDDRLGTPQLATDSGQNIAWQTTYDPFGNTGSIGGTITQDLRLPGQVFDPIGGEYLNGFRDYLPLIGRYIETDPLGRLGSGNDLYAYVGDNPVNPVDPLGYARIIQGNRIRKSAAGS